MLLFPTMSDEVFGQYVKGARNMDPRDKSLLLDILIFAL